jgi:metallophosphoesterase (TIGR00282 family)
MSHTILIFGDVMGRIGREGVKRALPEWRAAYQPDLAIANVENLTHGAGISMRTIEEMRDAGIDLFTSGNHVFDNADYVNVFRDPKLSEIVLRPENYPPGTPGIGAQIVTRDGWSVLVVNLIGRVFFRQAFDCPFRAVDRLLAEHPDVPALIDFHAEATSEKNTFGFYVDGRAAAVWGTHTHVPTADERLLPHGTAYITDIGMTGGMNGSIGVNSDPVLQMFLTQRAGKFEPIKSGACEVNAMVLKLTNGKATSIERLRKIVTIV